MWMTGVYKFFWRIFTLWKSFSLTAIYKKDRTLKHPVFLILWKNPKWIGRPLITLSYSITNIQHTMNESLTHISQILTHMSHKYAFMEKRQPLLVDLKEAAIINVFPLKKKELRKNDIYFFVQHSTNTGLTYL